MKPRIFRKVIVEYLATTGIYPKCSEKFLIKSALTFRRTISSSNNLCRLFTVNKAGDSLNCRSASKWAPNVIKSPIMDYPITEGTIVDSIWARIDQWIDKTALVI